MDNEIIILLEDIKHELEGLYRYKAFIAFYKKMGYYEVLEDDVIDLNYTDLIKRIDEVISDE